MADTDVLLCVFRPKPCKRDFLTAGRSYLAGTSEWSVISLLVGSQHRPNRHLYALGLHEQCPICVNEAPSRRIGIRAFTFGDRGDACLLCALWQS